MKDRPRILILGAQGQLGIALQQSFSSLGEVIAHGRESCNLSRPETIGGAVAEVSPDIILNAAAYTAVDRAETDQALAMTVNGEAPGILAEEARKRDLLLVHYSTDYVFDGSKATPWLEEDIPNPLSVYGASKLAGEKNIEQAGGRYLIFRTSWVFSPNGHNFLRTMLRVGQERDELRIVEDQIGAPTSAWALAEATRSVVAGMTDEKFSEPANWAGIYHMTCGGATSWCGFAKAIFNRARTAEEKVWPKVTGIASEEYPTPARRPKNSVLSNEKLRTRFGASLPAWEEAADEVLQSLGVLVPDEMQS